MPTEQTPLEYYHYYRASQKRVQQWVKKTSQELEAGTGTGGDGGSGGGSDLHLTEADSEDVGSGRRGSRRRSSASKPQTHDQIDSSRSRGPSSRSRSTRKKTKTDVHTRHHKSYSSDDQLAISSLLPFGLFPLIFALTPPSVATAFSATILLAGYFCVDYGVSISFRSLNLVLLRLIFLSEKRVNL